MPNYTAIISDYNEIVELAEAIIDKMSASTGTATLDEVDEAAHKILGYLCDITKSVKAQRGDVELTELQLCRSVHGDAGVDDLSTLDGLNI